MDGSKPDQSAIRRYLLGALDDEAKQEQIEEQLVVNEEFADELQVAEDQLIEDYLDDELTATVRQQFESFFLSTPQRRDRVQLAQGVRKLAAQPYPGPVTPPEPIPKLRVPFWKKLKPNFSSPWPVMAGFALIAAVATTSWFVFLRGPSADEVTASLNLAFKLQRPFESRVTGLNYAPVSTTRGGADNGLVNLRALEKAARLAGDAALDHETAETLRNEGRVFLVRRKFDRAIESLEKASKLEPKNAEIMNDLGVAQLEQSQPNDPRIDEAKLKQRAAALKSLKTAIALDPNLIAAYFNVALCVQALGPTNQAVEAWQEYLKRDTNSPWAAEAKKNLELLKSNKTQSKTADDIFQDFLVAYRAGHDDIAYRTISRNREMITAKLVPQQLISHFLNSDGDQQREYLAALKYVGRLENDRSHDPYYSKIAHFYERATVNQIRDSRTAYEAVKKGYVLCQNADYENALSQFDQARNLFTQTGNIWEANLCEYWLAYCEFQLDRILSSNDRLTRLMNYCEQNSYKWLYAQSTHWLSINASASKEISKALNFLTLSLRASEEVSDFYNVQKNYIYLAAVQSSVRQFEPALVNLAKALPVLNAPEFSLRLKWKGLDQVSQTFFAMGLYDAAACFEKEAIDLNADHINDVTFQRVAFASLSRICNSQKQYDDAVAYAQQSRVAAESMPNVRARQKGISFAFLQSAAAEFERGDLDAALTDYEHAISIYSTMEFKPYEYQAEKGRLLCYLAKGDEVAIQATTPKVLRLFEENRELILEEQNRETYFDEEQNVYDLVTDHEFARGNVQLAFDYAERSRSRSLLDWQNNRGKIVFDHGRPQIVFDNNTATSPLTMAEIQTKVPEQTQLLYFAILPKTVLIWLVENNRSESFAYDISRDQLTDQVVAFLDAVNKKDSTTQTELSRLLCRILIGPVEARLNSGKNIVVIPDKILCHLPFVALISEKTGKYLVEDYRFSYAPSASVFLLSTANAARRIMNEPGPERLLSIGNPTFDKHEFPGLDSLPSAEREARSITAFYTSPTLLVGPEATKQRIQQNMATADVIQFSGHYIANEQSYLRSSFAVAGSKQDSSWSNYELLEEHLDRPRLLILSACQTGIERYYRGEGMIGAGRAFLALGVPLVVATQWNVDSEVSEGLMVDFHRLRKQKGLPTITALQRAQQAMLNGPNPYQREPYYWAGFFALGGYAQY